MRNAAPRRPHKERSQPKAREKWGLLEKHKDYSLRAADYNQKKAKLSILQQKAKEKNPDEFAFGMMRQGARQGKSGQGGTENRLGHEAVRLLKEQDAGYLRQVLGRGRKEIEVTENLVKGGDFERVGGMGRRVLFDQEGNEKAVVKSNKRKAEQMNGEDDNKSGALQESNANIIPPGGYGNTIDEEEDDERQATPVQKKKKKQIEKEERAKLDLRAARKKRRRMGELRAAKLEALKKRQKEIMAVAEELDLQRAKMARTVGGVNKDGVKWKIRERKR